MADCPEPTIRTKQTLEVKKFGEVDGQIVVRTCPVGTGSYQPVGLSVGGTFTETIIVDYEWRPLPASPRVGREHVSFQNQSQDTAMKINFRDDVGYVGILVGPGGERHYDAKDDIVLYGRSASGSVVVGVEELE